MTADCWTCAHSIGSDPRTAKAFLKEGYHRGHGTEKGGVFIICEVHKTVASTPTYKCGYERFPGAEE